MTILADPKKRLSILLAIAGGALLLLLYTMFAGEEEAGAPLAATAPPSAPPPAAANAPVPSSMPGDPAPQAVPAPLPTPAAQPAATASIEGMRLHGITSGAAIIGLPSGRQRLVRVGQQVVPGVTLVSIAQRHAVLDIGSGQVRLTFQGPEAAAAAPGGASAPERPARDLRTEERRYLLGLQPRTAANGTVTGYVVRSGADLPLLRQAGLREGDVLISVNGEIIDGQERVMQIPAELATARTAEIEFIRDGRRMRTSVQLR